jgi:hypothetical protein
MGLNPYRGFESLSLRHLLLVTLETHPRGAEAISAHAMLANLLAAGKLVVR